MARPAQVAPDDPLYRTVALSHVARIPIVGVPVLFMTNSTDVLDAVLESFGMWHSLETHPELVATSEARVRIVLHEGSEGRRTPVPIRYRMPDNDRVIAHTAGSMGILDVGRGDAIIYVTSTLLRDRGRFQYGMLEALTLVLVGIRDRLPLHAAMIARGGGTLLLAGASGLGKSTLAYQARRAGWTLLADDGVYVQTTPRVRLWGAPRRLFLPPDAGRWFPEIAEQKAALQPNGKTKIAVPHAHDWSQHGPPVAERVAICVLDRATGAVTLDRIGRDAVRASLLADLAGQHDLYGDMPDRVLSGLCAQGGWRLRLTPHPPDAMPLLDSLVEEVARE